MKAAVFLDRDNTIIHNDGDLGDPNQVRLIQGVAPAIASLCGLGYQIIVVTNQGGVARGAFTEDDVQAVHERIAEQVTQKSNGARIDAFYYCPYHPEGTVEQYRREHSDRKPQPGMLQRAAEDYQLDLHQCWMVGDSLRDIQAGNTAGCRTILLQSDALLVTPLQADKQSRAYHEKRAQSDHAENIAEFTASNLIEAVRIIAQQRKPEPEDYRRKLIALERQREHEVNLMARHAQDTQPSQSEPPDTDDPQPPKKVGQIYQPPQGTKPFRPWNLPASELSSLEPIGYASSKAEKPAAKPSTPASPKQPAQQPPKQQPPAKPQPVSRPAPPKAFASEKPRVEQKPDATTEDAPPAPSSAKPAVQDAGHEKLLQQILVELRQQRSSHGEWNYLTIFALVLQAVAGMCLLGALWMGSNNFELFFYWMGSGLLIQIAVIAVLMFSSRLND